jgi:hypothetical protein
MFFERKRIDGISYSPLCRTALSAIAVASLLSAQAAFAGPPIGCNSNFPSPPAVAASPPAQFQNLPYFTNQGEQGASGAASAGTSVASVEASTSLMTEMVAQRRVQAAQACPVGFVNVDGICQPVRRASERSSTPRPKSSAGTSVSGGAPSTSPTKGSNLPLKPEPDLAPLAANGVWSEGLYDYEQRSGLGTALAPASRSQQTSGLIFGADHTFQSGGTQIIFGGLGSLSVTKQNFNNSTSATQNTTYSVDLNKVDPFTYPTTSVFDYTFPMSHALANQEQQTLTGGSGGLSASVSRGGFFFDSLFNAGFQNLNRTSTGSDTFLGTMKVASFEQGGATPSQNGCIALTTADPTFTGTLANGAMVKNGVIQNPVTFSNLQTIFSAISQATSATNLVLAQNVGYHYDLASGYWLEPLVGGIYTFSTYGSNAAALGLTDGYDLRLQTGARLGLTRLEPGKGFWTASFTGLVYSDVVIHGFVTNADGFSASYITADQGKLRFQGIWTAKLDLLNGFSAFIECQGRVGNDYWGAGGRVGGRYQF